MARSPVRGRSKTANSRFALEIPANTTATVRLPKAKLGQVTENGASLQASTGVSHVLQLEDAVTAELGSGSYVFESKY